MTGSAKYFGVGAKERLAAILHQIGMLCLKVRGEQPAHRDIGNRRQSFRRCGCRHVSKRFAPRFGKRRAAIGQHEPARDAGMANGHLQRHEPAIAITEHDGFAIAASLAYRFSHSVGDSSKSSAHGIRASEAW